VKEGRKRGVVSRKKTVGDVFKLFVTEGKFLRKKRKTPCLIQFFPSPRKRRKKGGREVERCSSIESSVRRGTD